MPTLGQPVAGTTTGVLQVYVKTADQIDIAPPTGIVVDDDVVNFPTDLTVDDAINHAVSRFGLSGYASTGFKMTVAADPTQTTLANVTTIDYIQTQYPNVSPLKFLLATDSTASVTISFQGATTQLSVLPQSLPISGVMLVASAVLGLPECTLLEVSSPSNVQGTDLLSTWVSGGAASFVVQIAVATQLVVLDTNGAIYYQHKLSNAITIAQLTSMIQNQRMLDAGTSLNFLALLPGQAPFAVPSSSTLSAYNQPIVASGSNANQIYIQSNSIDPTPVTSVTLMRLQQTPVTGLATVQNLFNFGDAQGIPVAPTANAGQLASAAAQVYGYTAGTFGVAVVGSLSPLPSSTPVNFSQSYILIETTVPLQWTGVQSIFSGQVPAIPEIDAA